MPRRLTQEELELKINENIKIINKESCALRPDFKILKKAQRDLAIHKEKLYLLEKKKELKENKKDVNKQIIECIKETEKFYYHIFFSKKLLFQINELHLDNLI